MGMSGTMSVSPLPSRQVSDVRQFTLSKHLSFVFGALLALALSSLLRSSTTRAQSGSQLAFLYRLNQH